MPHPTGPGPGTLGLVFDAAHAASGHAAALATTTGDTNPCEILTTARALRVDSMRALVAAVLHVRAGGGSWEQIGAHLGVTADTALALYGDYERQQQAGDPQPQIPGLPSTGG